MVKKQLFAQVGVFLLLGLNVAAYWFLWPNYHNVSSNEGKSAPQEKGVTRLVPETPPKQIAASSLKDAIPLNIPASPQAPDPKQTPEQEQLNKLFDHIKKDSTSLPQVTLPLEAPAPPPFPPVDLKKTVEEKADAPNLLPVLPAEPLRSDIEIPPPQIAVASALTPKMLPSPWQLSMEMVGPRTQLFAKLKQPGTSRVAAEFTIQCDRVEMKSPGGEMQALGKVTIVGAGLNASCQRLILPIHETRLVFEEKAQIHHGAVAGSMLRGERITWDLPASAPAPASPVLPSPFAMPGLGSPK